jgi:hypothetical protein
MIHPESMRRHKYYSPLQSLILTVTVTASLFIFDINCIIPKTPPSILRPVITLYCSIDDTIWAICRNLGRCTSDRNSKQNKDRHCAEGAPVLFKPFFFFHKTLRSWILIRLPYRWGIPRKLPFFLPVFSQLEF